MLSPPACRHPLAGVSGRMRCSWRSAAPFTHRRAAHHVCDPGHAPGPCRVQHVQQRRQQSALQVAAGGPRDYLSSAHRLQSFRTTAACGIHVARSDHSLLSSSPLSSSTSRRSVSRHASRPSASAAGATPSSVGTIDYAVVDADDPGLLESNGQGYDAAANAAYWATRPVPVVGRVLAIAREFGWWWLVKEARHKGNERAAAAALREVLVRLGPAFVKIGQALSSRPDVMPPDYLVELELLQDRIPPFPTTAALATMQQELKAPVAAVYSKFGEEPVAAASLGQVYRATLYSGQEVAVKVQRPGVVAAIALDTYILRWVAGALRQARKVNTDLPSLVDEWASSLFRELDYTREAANAQRFARLFAFMPEVKVPDMYLQHTTPKVLTMEWIEGERLRSASQQVASARAPAAAAAVHTAAAARSSSSRAAAAAAAEAMGGVGVGVGGRRQLSPEAMEDLRLVEVGVRCSLEQMLEEGFYHADPHPGNLLKTRDGRLAYLDFGMMGEIDVGVRQALIRATLHLVNREYGALAADFIALGLLPQGSDMGAIIPALTGVFQGALAGGVSNLSFGALSTDLGRTMYAYSFQIPPYYTLLVRSLSVLEGIALASDPGYKVLGAAYPWISRRLLTQPSEELRSTLRQLLYSEGHFRFDRLEQLLEQAAKAAVGAPVAAPAAADSGSSGGAAGMPLRPGSPMGSGRHQTDSHADASSSSSSSMALLAEAARQLPVIGWAAGHLAAAASAAGGGGDGSAAAAGLSGRGSAAATAGGPLALLLSPEGTYVREILEEELAKGLDAAWRLAADSAVSTTVTRVSGAVAGVSGLLPGPLQQLLPPALARSAGEGHAASEAAARQLLESLVTLPKLAAEDDVLQVEGITRLAEQLQALGKAQHAQQSAASTSNSRSQAVENIEAATASLQWLVSELELLGPQARREALAIPLAIAQKFSGRLAARALRAALAGSGRGGRPQVTGRSSPPLLAEQPQVEVVQGAQSQALAQQTGLLPAAAVVEEAAVGSRSSSRLVALPPPTTSSSSGDMVTASGDGSGRGGNMRALSSPAAAAAAPSRSAPMIASASSWGVDPSRAATPTNSQVLAGEAAAVNVRSSRSGSPSAAGNSMQQVPRPSSSNVRKRTISPVPSSSWGREASSASPVPSSSWGREASSASPVPDAPSQRASDGSSSGGMVEEAVAVLEVVEAEVVEPEVIIAPAAASRARGVSQ